MDLYRSYLVIEILITNSYDIYGICTYYLSVSTVLSEHEKKIIPKFGMIFLGDFLANGQISFIPNLGMKFGVRIRRVF